MTQNVECCGTPMRYVSANTSWEGSFGHGWETNVVRRTCDTCGADVVMTIRGPS